MDIKSDFVDLGYKMAAQCRENPEVFLDLLITAPSQRSILFSAYNSLRMRGKLKAIELLPEEARREIWQSAKDLAKGRLPTDKFVLLSKVLYTLNYLLETS
jgi:hypothetical protein